MELMWLLMTSSIMAFIFNGQQQRSNNNQLLRENQAAEGPKPGQTHYRNKFLYVCQPYFHTTNLLIGGTMNNGI